VRGILIAVTATALALGMTLGGPVATARAATGFESSYQFESAFLTLRPGDTGLFSVFFANTGTSSWVKGTSSQINLAVCSADKVTCNVASPYASFALGWVSPTAYATHQKDVVVPGDFSPFSYSIAIPRGQALGSYRFNGDLVLASTGERIRPEGYYHEALVEQAPIALAINPDFLVNEDNEVSSSVPGNGQHTYTVSTTLTGTLSFAIVPAANVVQNASGSYSFCDKNQDKKADGLGSGGVFFTTVNGVSVGASSIIVNQEIPANGQIRVTVDSSTRNQVARVVGWQDKFNNSGLDLTTAAADATCNVFQPYDSTSDGLIAVSGRKYYFGPQGSFGIQFPDASGAQCEPVFLHDTSNQVFSAGVSGDTSLRYRYDANDIVRLGGTRITPSVFKSELTAAADGTGDTVKIAYNPDPDGVSEFDICTNAGSDAPSNLVAATGNFDTGSTADDVRLTFTAPTANATMSYTIQRATIGGVATASNCTIPDANSSVSGFQPPTSDSAGTPAGSTFITVGGITVEGGKPGTFTNFSLADGGYCYRVVVQNPSVGLKSYSNYRPANIPGTADSSAPRSTSATLTQSAGFSNTLDPGDKLAVEFTESMSVSANAVIRVTDSDCGAATNIGPHGCSGGTANTVSDIVCGTNATCALQDGTVGTNSRLLITMTAYPITQATGSTNGTQFPIVFTDVNGVTDLSGNAWNLGGSSDRVIP
jgi:hypothetical protein